MSRPGSPAAPNGENAPSLPPLGVLGRREREVLSILRQLGCATVQQVADQLNTGLAYTTVMTTLDRLFRKGLLTRRKQNRAFLYSVALSVRDLEEHRAANLIHRFFSESDVGPEILVSCLVDAVHHYDTDLLDRLESSIRTAREQAETTSSANSDPKPGGHR
jgi:predicted transcriptional regulator